MHPKKKWIIIRTEDIFAGRFSDKKKGKKNSKKLGSRFSPVEEVRRAKRERKRYEGKEKAKKTKGRGKTQRGRERERTTHFAFPHFLSRPWSGVREGFLFPCKKKLPFSLRKETFVNGPRLGRRKKKKKQPSERGINVKQG